MVITPSPLSYDTQVSTPRQIASDYSASISSPSSLGTKDRLMERYTMRRCGTEPDLLSHHRHSRPIPDCHLPGPTGMHGMPFLNRWQRTTMFLWMA